MIDRCFKTGGSCEFSLEEIPEQVFIGLPFKYPYTDAFEYGVRPALQELGLMPWVGYEHPGSHDLFCKICEGLQTSSSAIIDISEPNPNVHFELGLLAGTSKPLVLIKQVGTEISTDLKGMGFAEYKDAKELYALVKERLNMVTAKAKTYPKIAAYATYKEFYRDCLLALSHSTKKVDLTHIRAEPPQDFEDTSDWFERVINWSDDNPYSRVRRIIAITNRRMLEWAQALSEHINDRPNRNFEVKVCRWDADFPAINLAIFDRKRVFVALTGSGATETAGFQISEHDIADFFLDYYNNIWGQSRPLNDFLRGVAEGEILLSEE